MSKGIFCFSLVCLSVSSVFSYAANLSPADESAIKAMKYKADVLGVRLGMPAEEAKSIVKSAITNGNFFEHVDNKTNQVYGWTAKLESCRHPKAPCGETFEVMVADGKVWYIERYKSYNREKTGEAPTMQATKKALADKYGALVSSADDGDRLYAAQSFARDGYKLEYSTMFRCGGNSIGGVPSVFSPGAGWFYTIRADQEKRDKNFTKSFLVSLVDCEYMFDVINSKAMAEEAAEKAISEIDAAKGIKPRL